MYSPVAYTTHEHYIALAFLPSRFVMPMMQVVTPAQRTVFAHMPASELHAILKRIPPFDTAGHANKSAVL